MTDNIFYTAPHFEQDIVKAKDEYMYDASSKEYIDFESGIWCCALGHSNDRVNQAIKDQLDKVTHLHTKLVNSVSKKAADDLLRITGIKKGKAVFLTSGSEAVEMGLKLSFAATDRKKAIMFSNSYYSALGTTGNYKNEECIIKKDFTSYDEKNPESFFSEIDFSQVACCIFELGSASGRVLFPHEKLVQQLSQRVKLSGGYVVSNEVTTGYGRTGRWFGFQHYDIMPDIVCMGKGIGNGYPVSAAAMTDEVARAADGKGLGHVQSHQNDPLGGAVVSAVIKEFEEKELIRASAVKGKLLSKELMNLKEKFQCIKDVRGRGMMYAVEFERTADVAGISAMMFEKGFLIGANAVFNVLRFDPCLTINAGNILKMVKELENTLNQLV
ncbi:MAG: aspartate aminotransferase family protein [Petrotogaceae bacterium]|nr:aspartate aminotransferase family protein [Petrotogaceae bacterium]